MELIWACVLVYAAGVAALSVENYGIFKALLTRPVYHDHAGDRPLLLELNPLGVLRAELRKFLSGYLQHHTPASDYRQAYLPPVAV